MKRRKLNKRPKLHIKKGDTVRVLSGKARGEEGKVLKIEHKTDKYTGAVSSRAIVENLNMVTKHRRPDQQNPQGSIVETEAGIHVSNLMLVDPKSGSPTRIGRTKTEKGWVRVSKKSGEIIN
ncbi:MAG: 50S ribosomal protein L24 [Bacteroidota bacterium]